MDRTFILPPAHPDSMPKPRGLLGASILLWPQKHSGGECAVCLSDS